MKTLSKPFLAITDKANNREKSVCGNILVLIKKCISFSCKNVILNFDWCEVVLGCFKKKVNSDQSLIEVL